MMDFCKDNCQNNNTDMLSDGEKKCLKSCSNKYLQQFQIFDKNKTLYLQKYGYDIFLFNKNHKDNMNRLIELMALNKNYKL
jgi:hypothetical protein